jgi:uncharacterized protein YjbJ (UPF0337 family)
MFTNMRGFALLLIVTVLSFADSDPNRDQTAGRADTGAGETKQDVGRATENDALEEEGANQTKAGEAREQLGDAKAHVEESVEEMRDAMKS